MRRSWFRAAEAIIGRIESAEALDGPGHALGNAIVRPMQIVGRPSQVARNAAHGTWYGHPVHPMLITIPIGSWTLALALDGLSAFGPAREQDKKRTAADTALRAGVAGAVAAAVAGLSDWQYTDGRDRRLGLVHALVNSTALSLNIASLVLRARGQRTEGR